MGDFCEISDYSRGHFYNPETLDIQGFGIFFIFVCPFCVHLYYFPKFIKNTFINENIRRNIIML